MDEKEDKTERMKVPVTYSVIFQYIGTLKRCLEEGEAIVNSTFIADCFVYKKTKQNVMVKCSIFQLVTSKPPHEIDINIQIEPDIKISLAKCSCEAGLSGTCKHAVATLLYLHQKEVLVEPSSCTTERQKWGKELKKKASLLHPLQAVENMHCFKNYEENKLKLKHRPNVQRAQNTIMKNLNYMPAISRHFQGQTKPSGPKRCTTSTTAETSVPDLEFFEGLLKRTSTTPYPPTHDTIPENNEDIQRLFDSKVSVTLERSYEIFSAPQQSNAWFEARQFIVTGTSAAKMMSSTNLRQTAIAVLKKDFQGNEATKYGNKMEPYARRKFERLYNLKVRTCGLIVNQEWNHLGFSPDGIVLGSSLELLEIKCPINAKNIPVICDGMPCVDYLQTKDDNIQLSISKRGYFNQVQYGMYILNLDTCHFHVYSPKGSVTIEIKRDDEFLRRVIPKVHECYFVHLLPMLAAAL